MHKKIETVDLTNCDREPIHLLGEIQPFGFLIALTLSDWKIACVSANIETWLRQKPDVLIGKASLESALVSWQRGLLDFLPAGTIPPNPSELLGSGQMADLLKDLATRYDIIVLDAPPLLPVTDAAVLATVADGAILVARHGSTRKEQVRQAAEALHQVNARLLGTVLNFAPRRKRRGYSGDYGYGYGYGYGYQADASTQNAETADIQPVQPKR